MRGRKGKGETVQLYCKFKEKEKKVECKKLHFDRKVELLWQTHLWIGCGMGRNQGRLINSNFSNLNTVRKNGARNTE